MIADKFIKIQSGSCETTLDAILSFLKIVIDDVHGVLTFLCKYDKEIELGTSVVGFPEAVPIEKAVCELNSGLTVAEDIINEAITIVHAVRDVIECSELRYEITQYALYSNS